MAQPFNGLNVQSVVGLPTLPTQRIQAQHPVPDYPGLPNFDEMVERRLRELTAIPAQGKLAKLYPHWPYIMRDIDVFNALCIAVSPHHTTEDINAAYEAADRHAHAYEDCVSRGLAFAWHASPAAWPHQQVQQPIPSRHHMALARCWCADPQRLHMAFEAWQYASRCTWNVFRPVNSDAVGSRPHWAYWGNGNPNYHAIPPPPPPPTHGISPTLYQLRSWATPGGVFCGYAPRERGHGQLCLVEATLRWHYREDRDPYLYLYLDTVNRDRWGIPFGSQPARRRTARNHVTPFDAFRSLNRVRNLNQQRAELKSYVLRNLTWNFPHDETFWEQVRRLGIKYRLDIE